MVGVWEVAGVRLGNLREFASSVCRGCAGGCRRGVEVVCAKQNCLRFLFFLSIGYALWAVVAASTAYTSFFFCLPSRARRFWAPSSITLLLSWFSTFARTTSAMAGAPSISTFSCMLCLMWHFQIESASGRLTFRSIAVQLDSSSARQQSLFRSIVVPCEIKSSGHSGRFDLN